MKTQSNPNKITLTQARRVLEVVDAGLSKGIGRPKPGQMCVEAAVCFALGQPHGDEPNCVHSTVRSFKIALNDELWSSNTARAKGMRRIAIAQLGSLEIDGDKFRAVLSELTIRRIVPIGLRAAASMKGNSKHKDALEAAAVKCEKEGTKESAVEAKQITRNAAYAYAYADAYAYAYVDAYAYADAAAYAAYVSAAADAAYVDAYAYADATAYAAYVAYVAAVAGAAYVDADANANRDTILTICAEIGVDALRACSAPGIKLMDRLCPI